MSCTSARLLEACRQISNQATEMAERARWSGMRAGDHMPVGRRGIAEGIVADHLSALSSSVARGDTPEAAYQQASEGLKAAIQRFNAPLEWQVWRSDDFGQDKLRQAFWQLQEASKE